MKKNGNKKKSSDFRYDTGETRVPWAAVGEKVKLNDILEIVKFLIPSDKENGKHYNNQLNIWRILCMSLWMKCEDRRDFRLI